MSNKIKLLFLAANPIDTDRLQLDEEIRLITQKIRGAEHRDRIELIPALAVRPDDLLQLLNEHKPDIVHFSGHGSPAGEIVLVDNTGQAKPVNANALKLLFTTLKDNVRLVALNACYSWAQANAIVSNIDCAVGTNKSISDKAAIIFAASLYRAFGFGRSVKEAFDQAKTALVLEGISEEKTLELLCRPGIDPAQVYILKSSHDQSVKASAQFHSDIQHTGDYSAVAGSVQSNGQLKWSYSTGGAVRSSPVVVDGVVYVGSDDGSVHAVDAATGKKIWSYPTGGSVDSSPAVFDGIVYVGSNDGNLYAINAYDGTKLWSFHTADWIQSSPVVSNGIVYVGSDDHNIYAVNAATGLAQWSQPFTTDDVVSSSPAVYNNVVYVGSNDGYLYAINAYDGTKLWNFQTGASVTSSPIVAGGVVFVGNVWHFYVLGLGGALKWKIDHAVGYNQASLSPPAYAYAGGTVYVAWPGLEAIVNYYNVRAYSISTGARLWDFGRQGYYRPSLVSSPAVTNDMLYVGTTLTPSSSAGQSGIYALNIATGKQVWYFATKGHVDSSPTVVAGVVYVGSNDRNLYAIGTQSN